VLHTAVKQQRRGLSKLVRPLSRQKCWLHTNVQCAVATDTSHAPSTAKHNDVMLLYAFGCRLAICMQLPCPAT
jgi:hypothetical protein